MQPTCPTCRAAPAALVECDACEERYSPFVTAGACPRCALVWDALTCQECDRRALLETWLPVGAERCDFLERMLGGDPPLDDPTRPWTTTWNRATHVLTTDVLDLLTPADEAHPDPTAARAAILEAEAALEAARRAEQQLAALSPEASAAALAPEVEAARKTSRMTVDAAARALESVRADAQVLHRRRLDRKRVQPVEPPPPPAAIAPGAAPAAACPACAWRPDGFPRWPCTGCELALDPFAATGRCVGCGRKPTTIRCVGCLSRAPLEAWRRAGGGKEATTDEAPSSPAASAPFRSSAMTWLAGRVAGALDQADPRQRTLAGALERAAGATDRALDQVVDLVSLGVAKVQAGEEGKAKLEAKDWKGVVAECTAALRAAPERAGPLGRRGCAYRNLGDDDRARADLDAALRQSNVHPEFRGWVLCERARLRYALNDLPGCVADTTEAILLRPRDPFALALRGWAHREQRAFDLAVRDLDEAVRLSNRSRRILLNRMTVLFERGDWTSAEADATEAIQRGLLTLEAFWGRARARLRLGRHDDARDDATASLRLTPESGFGYLSRANARLARGDVPGALKDLARLRRVDPWARQTGAATPLAFEAFLRGEPERAASLLRDERSRTAHPEHAALRLALILRVSDPLPEPQGGGWPGCLLRYVRGELTFEALVALVPASDPQWSTAECLCEAHGYAALVAERDGRDDDARRHHQACVDTGVAWFYEFTWSAVRLAGLSPRAPRPQVAPPPAPTPSVAPSLSPSPRTATTGSATSPSLADQLERLARLREQGILTPDEFALAKRRILGL